MGQFARKFLANYTILAAGDLVAKVLLLLATMRMARVLGTDLFGDIAFAAAFTAYFSLLVSQGLGTFGMQEVARNPARIREYAGNILAMRLCASLAAATLLAVTVLLLRKPPEVKLLLLLSGLMFFSSAFSMTWVFQALEQMKFVAASTVLSQLVFSACILGLLDSPSRTAWVPVLQFAGEALAALYMLYFLSRNFGALCLSFDFRAWHRIWKESLPIGISAALSMVLYNFDIVLLGFMKSPAEVGQYSAAYRFINFFVAFLALYATNIFPSVSRCRDKPTVLARISDRSARYTLLLSIPLAAGGMMVARPLMKWFFGPEFTGGAGALSILLWVIPIMACRSVHRATLLSHGFQREFLWIALLAAAVNTALNLVLIPRFSYLGAAATSVAGELIVSILVYQRVSCNVARLAIWPHLWGPLIACLPMIALLHWYQGRSLPFLIGGGFAVYAICGWALGAIKPVEIWKEIHSPESPLELNVGMGKSRK